MAAMNDPLAAPVAAATERYVPGTGQQHRHTIVVLVNGKSKAAALRAVCEGDLAPTTHPGQVLRAWSAKVTWLADEEAAALL